MSNIVELKYEEEDLGKLAGFTLLDDDFMTIVFDRNIEVTCRKVMVDGENFER